MSMMLREDEGADQGTSPIEVSIEPEPPQTIRTT